MSTPYILSKNSASGNVLWPDPQPGRTSMRFEIYMCNEVSLVLSYRKIFQGSYSALKLLWSLMETWSVWWRLCRCSNARSLHCQECIAVTHGNSASLHIYVRYFGICGMLTDIHSKFCFETLLFFAECEDMFIHRAVILRPVLHIVFSQVISLKPVVWRFLHCCWVTDH